MRVRYKETDVEADVEFRDDENDGLILVGNANICYPGELDACEEWYVASFDFADEFELVEATQEERLRLIAAGFPIDGCGAPIIVGDTPT